MPEAFDRPLDDEEPEAVRPCRTEPKKWLEYELWPEVGDGMMG